MSAEVSARSSSVPAAPIRRHMGDRGGTETAERSRESTRRRSRVLADVAHVRSCWPVAAAGWLVGALAVVLAGGGAVPVGLVLVAALVPAVIVDVRARLIPNWLTGGTAAALMFVGLATDPTGLPEHLLAAVAVGGFLLVAALARPGEMGMGDVKLAAVLGLALGAAAAVALLVALVAAAAVGLSTALRSSEQAVRATSLPLGPFLALGAAAAYFGGDWAIRVW